MKRLHAIRSIHPDVSGQAMLLNMEYADGSTEPLEVLRGDIPDLFRALLAACVGLGEIAPTIRPLVATTPADAVVVPADELHAVTVQSGSLWLMMRAGIQDFAFAFPDPRAARALGDSLVSASQKR